MIWKPITEFDGEYEVSDEGVVRRAKPARGSVVGHVFTPRPLPAGYMHVNLRWKGTWQHRYVHHLVAKEFIGPRPQGMEINHKNGIKADNSLSNLEYVSKSENGKHAYRTGLRKDRGENSNLSLITEEKARAIKEAVKDTTVTQRSIAKKFGVTPVVVHYIKTGKTWAWL